MIHCEDTVREFYAVIKKINVKETLIKSGAHIVQSDLISVSLISL